jgi:hypothetical protein
MVSASTAVGASAAAQAQAQAQQSSSDEQEQEAEQQPAERVVGEQNGEKKAPARAPLIEKENDDDYDVSRSAFRLSADGEPVSLDPGSSPVNPSLGLVQEFFVKMGLFCLPFEGQLQ